MKKFLFCLTALAIFYSFVVKKFGKGLAVGKVVLDAGSKVLAILKK